jgi:maleate isomerase
VRTVGLIVPSSNPTVEAFLPHVADVLAVRFLITRIGVRRIAADPDADSQFDPAALQAAAELLCDAEVELVSWAGTSGFWLGGERETAALAAVSEALRVPVTSSRVAMLAALGEVRDAKLGVLTPYVPAVHRPVLATLVAAGHIVVADRALGIERNLDFASIPSATLAAELAALVTAGAEVLTVVCTNVAATRSELATAPHLVVDSVLATLWHAAREIGASTSSYSDCYRAVLDTR